MLILAYAFQSQKPGFSEPLLTGLKIWPCRTYEFNVEFWASETEVDKLGVGKLLKISSRISSPSLQESWRREPPPGLFCLPSSPSLETGYKLAFARAGLPHNAAAAMAMTLITIAYYSKPLIESWSHRKCDLTCCFTACSGTANKK